MSDALYPINYLTLIREDGKRLIRRDAAPGTISIAAACAMLYFMPNLNVFGDSGIIDRVGSLASTLTGFYVAALVAAATFTSHMSNLDSVMENGRIFLPSSDIPGPTPSLEEDGEGLGAPLTRRQYICAMFGYLALLALTLSITSIVLVSMSAALSDTGTWYFIISEYILASFYVLLTAHLAVTTSRGVYYLSFRMYLGEGDAIQADDNSEER